MVLTVEDIAPDLNAEGFLSDAGLWNEQVAECLARQNGIMLSPAHWEIVLFIRAYYFQYRHLPNARMFAAALRKQLGEDKSNSRYLLSLFPGGPLKYACKLAGLPKPPTCL